MSADSELASPYKRELARAREEFGVNLARWRRINNWSQQTPEQWGHAAGFYVMHNSQWSRLERGDMGMPGPLLFLALGILNSRIASEDWGPITNSALRDRVRGSVAVMGSDGKPWTSTEFYASFTGQLAWPPFPHRKPKISKGEADAWNRQFRLWFEEITACGIAPPLQAMAQLMEHVPADYQVSMQHAVMGLGGFSAGELEQLSGPEGMGPEQWLHNWQAASDLSLKLQQGTHWRHVKRDSAEDPLEAA